ncbi:SH3 domain-containing protein [Flavobacterium sp. ZT3R18]|uniref:SH3 domain-containing protein n=1 Tax=Flavobacterium sp. ZT3R18 TaxID=2594429 RepID=UPI00117A81AA|nr:SH3 domain-containing protein [Flavobacterium sp. ZT3R18]TRX35340.1 SH3 domain-containing protein [Flavobacterium sp. ZT3R18]
MKTLILALFCFSIHPIYSIGLYKKGDKLYNWNRSGLDLYTGSNNKCEIIASLPFETQCTVIDDHLKKSSFEFVEIEPKLKEESEGDNFPGFSISGFWVKIKTKDGQIGYVFDGYLSKIKPGFKLDKSCFDKEFKLIKSKTSKPNPKKDNAYSYFYLYKNGASIQQTGSDYDSHIHYFIPNISLEEAYLLIKTPDYLDLSKASGDEETSIHGNDDELSFSSTLENTTLKKINTKTKKGVVIILEAFD